MQLTSRALVLLLALGAGAAAVACEDNSTINNPSTPTPTTTETFAGTVTVNGAVTHIFAVTQRGAVTATLTAAGADNTSTIGVSLGTWNGTTCQIILANDQAVVGAGVLGTVSGVGNLCLRVYDVGKLAAATTYSVDVAHP
jgi:hypothetical protein